MNKENTGKVAELKDRLREALSDNNMKPIELSEKTDIPKSMISYYLSGRSIPKADRIYKISKTLGVSEAWLMGYDVPKAPTPEQKKNDDLVKIIALARKDSDFFDTVSKLAKLRQESAEDYAAIKHLVATLRTK